MRSARRDTCQPRQLFLVNAPSRHGRLERENARLKALGVLTLEVKKREES